MTWTGSGEISWNWPVRTISTEGTKGKEEGRSRFRTASGKANPGPFSFSVFPFPRPACLLSGRRYSGGEESLMSTAQTPPDFAAEFREALDDLAKGARRP